LSEGCRKEEKKKILTRKTHSLVQKKKRIYAKTFRPLRDPWKEKFGDERNETAMEGIADRFFAPKAGRRGGIKKKSGPN